MSFLGASLASFLAQPGEQGTAPTFAQSLQEMNQTSGSLGTAGATVAGKVTSFLGLTVERAATIIIGLILIAAGVFMFRPVRETIVTTAKTAAKVGTAA